MRMDTRFNGYELARLLWSIDPIRLEYVRLCFEKYRDILRETRVIPPPEFLKARSRLVREIAAACPKESGWTEIKVDKVIHLGVLQYIFEHE